jgi:hypothetical protein
MMTALAVVGGALLWQIGGKLSADAVGMAVGVLFGILAGIPTALLLVYALRRQEAAEQEVEEVQPGHSGRPPFGYGQAPVIVLAAPMQNPAGYPPPGYGQPALPGPVVDHQMPAGYGIAAQRRFKMVGEREEWIEE